MGVDLYWEPHVQVRVSRHLDIGPRSEFVAMMRERFGNDPWIVNDENLPYFAVVCLDMDDTSCVGAYKTIKEALTHHAAVKIDPVY